MGFVLPSLFGDLSLPKEKIAEMLRTSPDALAAFEKSYQTNILPTFDSEDDLARPNAKAAVSKAKADYDEEIVRRIVDELLPLCSTYTYKRGAGARWRTSVPSLGEGQVSVEEIGTLPTNLRPQLTGSLMRKDCEGSSYPALFFFLDRMAHASNEKERMSAYHHFRQGLDILDLDGVLYEMLGKNKNSMGYWLPKIAGAVENLGFFKIPSTTILKVPLTMLQLTRIDFDSLTGTTKEIVNRVCEKAFGLEADGDYFIKTGTYSSKFDFRNARVRGAKEVHEIGEYFLYLQNAACMMTGPLAQPSIYGVSTTNEWCVREYIEDKEKNPCIYKGLPLHTEYRFFVDFTYGVEVGVTPYWDPETMKKRFSQGGVVGNNVHDYHDYVVYKAHEEALMARYNANVERIGKEIYKFAQAMNDLCNKDPENALWDQWSVDIMQNGDDFWLIDMAVAETSAFYDKCVPPELRNPQKEDWLPEIR